MTTTTPSLEIYDRLCQVIPGGVNSPVRAFKDLLPSPIIAERGCGDRIVDVEGNEYIDYCMSWGALIHGHVQPQVTEAVQKRLLKGSSFGLSTEIEEKIASRVVSVHPTVEKVRFVSSGTEATMSAVRLARGYTGKDLIVKFTGNYHGHADFFLVNAGSGVFDLNATSSSAGVPKELVTKTISLPYNEKKECQEFIHRFSDQIAAVIIEPVAGNMGVVPADLAFLKMLREETKKHEIILIFDEVITGFRLALGGAQEYYGIDADLTCLGKIIGGGFPAAAYGGKKEIMDRLSPLGDVYQAGTLSGNPVAMEAGYQALGLLLQDGFYEQLLKKTQLITKPVKEMIEKKQLNASLQQVGSMFTLFLGRKSVANMEEAKLTDKTLFSLFFRFMLSEGIYIPPSPYEAWFVSMAHLDEDLKKTADAIMHFLSIHF